MAEALTPPTVRWAYRLLLGRDPESDSVIQNWCTAGRLSELREGILTSPEMAELAFSGFPEKGSWIDSNPTIEAIEVLLAIRDEQFPEMAAVEDFRQRHTSLRSMRRFLLTSPSIERSLPQPEGPRTRKLRFGSSEMMLHGDSRDPEYIDAPGLAPRFSALLRAAWPDGGEGRVIVESGAGIGVVTLGLAAAAPRHGALVAHEPSLRKAAVLEQNLATNGLTSAVSRPGDMGDVRLMMEREDLGRLDFLRLNEPGAARLATEMAPWLLERGAITLVNFDLADLLTEEGSGPRGVLAACRAAFPYVVAFGGAHEPHLLLDSFGMDAALHRTLMRPDRRDEFILCADLDWLDRFEVL
jgi:hypothetical protein